MEAFPMTASALLEPSFADAAAAIEAATDLPHQTRTQWLCALRQIAKMIGRPMDSLAARWTAARFPIERLHHARVGANPKTLANYKSNARAALKWFAGVQVVPTRGTPITREWHLLRDRLSERRARSVLSSLMRYCSARRIVPEAMNEAVIDAYMKYRAETTALACDAGARRSAFEIGRTFVKVKDKWWIILPAFETKEKRLDERQVDDCLEPWFERYLAVYRPVLARNDDAPAALWLSSNDGRAMTYSAVERVISATTKVTVGIDISPHLFRAAGVSSCAVWAGDRPHLGSALLHHDDPATAQEHYNHATSLSANQSFVGLIKSLRRDT
jgi:hypothetical protein